MQVKNLSAGEDGDAVRQAGTLKWVMEFPPDAPRVADPLMGWTSSTDTRAQVQLTFDTKEEAVPSPRSTACPIWWKSRTG